MIRTTRIILFMLLMCFVGIGQAEAKKKDGDDTVAREMFTKMFNMVYGPQGSTLTYKVNIVGLYKTEGTIVYKGKKCYYKDAKGASWFDGKTAYVVKHKQKEVTIYRGDDESRDKYMSKFKFNPDQYNFSYTTQGNYYLITATVKESSMFGIKYVTIKAQKENLYPVSVKVKVAFMHTTVQISDFHPGNISDATFHFPAEKFKGYKVIDKR